MRQRKCCAKINVKLLVILIVVVVGLGVSLVAARQIRRGILSEKALAAGQEAFEKQDWPVAVKRYREYLGRHPDDLSVLRKYAEALMSTRPIDGSVVTGAISAYRRIMQLDPGDATVPEKLAGLYSAIRNYEELASIAKARMGQDPNDLQAPLWLADALVRLNKGEEAGRTLETFIRRLDTLPGKHAEYVRACAQMCSLAASRIAAEQQAKKPGAQAPSTPQAAAEDQNASQQPTPLDWLNKAVAYAPESAEALVYRSRFHRLAAGAPDVNQADKPAFLALARRDLEEADAVGTDDPRIRYSLGAEWLLYGELDRAAAELQAADRLPKDKLKAQFFDMSDWTVARFLLGSEVAMRRGVVAEAAALADETLASLSEKEKGYRGQALPAAVRVYVTAGRTTDAKQCLDEYLALVQAQQVQAPSAQEIASLKALVEAAGNRPYGVIDLLGSVAGSDPNDSQMLRLLAQAYSQTGQAGRAVNALEQCRRLNPQDRQIARELARQYARTGDFEKAFDAASEAELQNPTDVDLKLLRIGAELSRSLGLGQAANTSNLKALSQELAGLRQQYPDRVGIRIFQSIIAGALDQPQVAEQELKQAIAECKEPLRAEIQLIRHYVSAGRLDDALGVCEASCARQKDIPEPWLILSDLRVMKQDYDSARLSLRQGLQAVTDSRGRRLLSTKLALLELARGDRAAGISLLKEVASDPQEIQARLLLLRNREIREDPNAAGKLIGELRQAEGESGLWWRLYQASLWLSASDATARQQDITNVLQYCIRADPTWPEPVLLLAQMYARQNDMKQAEDTYRQGLLGNPSSTELADGLLSLLVGQGRFADAEKILRQIQNPRVSTDWRVRLAVGAGDFSRAIDELRLRVSNDKQDAVSRIELARLTYQETEDAAQAMRYLDEAKAIAPASRTLAAVRAFILRSEGKPEEALRILDDYVRDYNNFEAYSMRAAYLAETGDPERAEQDYRKLITFEASVVAGVELLANFYAGLGKFDQAVAAAEEGLRTHPEDLRLKRGLMQLLLSRNQAGDRVRALGILAELEKQSPQDTSLMMARATQRIEEGTPQSFAQAKEILEGIVKLEPTATNAHLALIGMAMQERQYQTACDLAIRALGSNPSNARLLLARARAELELGYASMAAKLARQVLQQDPNSVDTIDVFTQAAQSSGEQGLLDEARTVIDAAVRRSPADERLSMMRAQFYAGLRQPAAAIPGLEAYCRTEAGSRSITALVTLADLYRAAGDLAKADEAIKKVEQLEPDKQMVIHARFLWLAAQRRFDDLKQICPKYAAAKDQDGGVILRAGAMLMSFDPPELKAEGIKLFRHAVSLWPTSADARMSLASALYQAGDAQEAEKTYRELLEQYPEDTRALNDLAWILQERSQGYDEALKLANKGLEIANKAPGSASTMHLLDTKGTILLKMPDRLAEARRTFQDILGVLASSSRLADPRREAGTCLQLGRICLKLNDPAESRQYLERALEIDRKANVLTPEERAEIGRLIEELVKLSTPATETQK